MATTSMNSAPPDTNEFKFACPCLNVQLDGRISNKDFISSKSIESGSGGDVTIWIDERAETIRQPAYLTWTKENDDEEDRPSRRRGSVINSSGSFDGAVSEQEETGPRWRTCWICKTKIYRAEKKSGDEGIENDWVAIDPKKGIIWGRSLEEVLHDTLLPFSQLSVPLSSSTSSFGRPPQSNSPSLYPPAHEAPVIHKLIPPVSDPFFLPPPFIPSHPLLRDLCTGAVTQLNEQHQRLEEEVKEFIALKSRQMRDLEDKVRSEVELLWTKYLEIPGKRHEVERSRSSSVPRAGEDRAGEKKRDTNSNRDFTGPKSPVANPIIAQSVISPPYNPGSSLLSASLSANSFHAPPPPSHVADKVDDSIMNISKTMEKKSDARAVAMSHVFSVLDDHMQGSSRTRRLSGEKTSTERENREIEAEFRASQEEQAESAPSVDSWIEEERKVLAASRDLDGDEECPGGTPRPLARKELTETKGKERPKAVTFEEPEKAIPGELPKQPMSADKEADQDQDEYVFDFELDDQRGENGLQTGAAENEISHKSGMRSRNMVEANLSRTFAADAPSHRAAWRRMEQDSSIYASIRRTSTDSIGDESDESAISKLAISVPLDIVMNRNPRVATLPAMERKTSLSEREGLFVPPLKSAMRKHTTGHGPPGRPSRQDVPRKTSRSASVSREREAVKSYAADPGAVFETLGDEQDGGSDEDDGEQEGTLRDSRTFVPPHMLARRESHEGAPEVGWRSLIT